jgi:DNA-binding transcriptional MocR family regulator
MAHTDLRPLIASIRPALNGQGPLYELLANAIRDIIVRGEWLPATCLPSERALAKHLQLSRTTVVLAYTNLRQSGHIESRHGSGTWVRRIGKSNWPSPQEQTVSSTFRRNVVFRSLLERTGDHVGFVAAHLAPLSCVEEAAREVAKQNLQDLIGRDGYFPMGLPALRQEVANHLSRQGLPTRENEILITSGAQQGISLLTSLLVARGETVITEDPTYIGAIDVFSAMGARVVAVPGAALTLDLDHLRTLLATRPRLLYIVPTYHNPTGGCLPDQSRREIACLCEELQVPVVEDLTLAGTGLEAESPPPIASYTKNAPILTMGSFSKLFWAGLRVGFLRGPEALITRIGRWKALADLGSPLYSQAIAVRLVAEWRTAEKMRRRELNPKLECLEKLLRTHLPGWTWKRPKGGLLLWVCMDHGDASELSLLAARQGVTIVPGSGNSPDHHFSNYIRFPFVADPQSMEEGISRLALAVNEYIPKPVTSQNSFDVIV